MDSCIKFIENITLQVYPQSSPLVDTTLRARKKYLSFNTAVANYINTLKMTFDFNFNFIKLLNMHGYTSIHILACLFVYLFVYSQ